MSTLIIIPARSGSKGLVKKNLKYLGPKPLISYTIEYAKTICGPSDYICLSSNDSEVINIANELGLSHDFIRSQELSNDNASMYDVLIDAIQFYEKRNMFFHKLLLLQPTSPFRKIEDYENLLKEFESKNCEMTVTVTNTKENPYFTLVEKKSDGYIHKSKASNFTRRQDCPQVYSINGSMYLMNINSLKENGSLNFKLITASIMPKKRSVDIDDIDDFNYAEYLLNHFNK